jgi:anti-sigma regulatory factor (Ser/Thr protein kinase)
MDRSAASSREFAPRPDTVREARKMALEVGRRALGEDGLHRLELLVSELVSNAVVHAGTTIVVEVHLADSGEVVVEVTDGSPHRPVPRGYARTSVTGRGLGLVEELSDGWGVVGHESGKTVWFRLSPGRGSSTEPAPEPDRGASADTGAVEVRLMHVPLGLHARWQEHAAGLLREYLLATLDEVDPAVQVARHAACSDALALLRESLDGHPQAVERADTTVWVPRASVAHFATLDETLDRAVGKAIEEDLLSSPTEPRMRHFRRWVCTQVAAQAAGAAATPYREP